MQKNPRGSNFTCKTSNCLKRPSTPIASVILMQFLKCFSPSFRPNFRLLVVSFCPFNPLKNQVLVVKYADVGNGSAHLLSHAHVQLILDIVATPKVLVPQTATMTLL